jgi:hypothetical protein
MRRQLPPQPAASCRPPWLIALGDAPQHALHVIDRMKGGLYHPLPDILLAHSVQAQHDAGAASAPAGANRGRGGHAFQD